jgi:hypothetical protein
MRELYVEKREQGSEEEVVRGGIRRERMEKRDGRWIGSECYVGSHHN